MTSVNNWNSYYEAKRDFLKYPDENLIRFINKEIANVNANDLHILDLGCGTGRNTVFLSDSGLHAFGVECSESAIEIAKSLSADRCISYGVCDFEELCFDDNYFDFVVDIQSLQHNSSLKIKKIIEQILRVLKENGKYFGMLVSDNDHGYGKGDFFEVGTRTNIVSSTFEGVGLTHFFTKKEILSFFASFTSVSIETYERSINNMQDKISYFLVVATK
ncbi:class I SAM-dependent methyltransferase [Gammaproteobacteria bacterium]|nr:class I SAM-dependent methyltransferase [Gammaproteobacteria bacterium]